MLFDEKRVAQIAKRGKTESWPYPKVFHDLKEAGVTSHEVWIEAFKSIYKNGSQEWIEPIPDDFYPVETQDPFNETAVQHALIRHQNHETTYVEFLKNIAAAGVISYTVDMSAQTVTYKGRSDFYIQHIPPYRA